MSASTRNQIYPSVAEAIGATPLVALSRLTTGLEGHILAKLDCLNPGGSKKDRVARRIIEDAEQNGTLQPGQSVVELTSGNTGTGLAIVCQIKKYPFVAVMSRGNSQERAGMMRALGAEVMLVDQASGSSPVQVTGDDLALAEQQVQRIVKQRKAFRADQFHHIGNFHAHYEGTGPELWDQSGGRIDVFCDFVGTGGTFSGCAAYLKSRDPEIACYIVEPHDAAPLSGNDVVNAAHAIQGGGYAMGYDNLPLLNREHVDGYVRISSDQATDATRRLAREEGIFAGYSSGANIAAAMKLLRGPCRGKSVAIVICDSGLKYFTTDLWKIKGAIP